MKINWPNIVNSVLFLIKTHFSQDGAASRKE